MIPERLRALPLILVEEESKKPMRDSRAVVDPDVAEQWVDRGGNVAVSLLDDTIVVDVDSYEVSEYVSENLPETFTVRTGGGWVHLYFRCPGWDDSTSFKSSDGDELGSVRSDGWIAVAPPSIHPETGEMYQVKADREIVEIEEERIEEIVDEFSGRGSGSEETKAERERGKTSGELDELDELIHHDEYRAKIRGILQDSGAGHVDRLYLAGFLLDTVGLSEREVCRIIDKFNRWSNYDREITREQVASVAGGSGR